MFIVSIKIGCKIKKQSLKYIPAHINLIISDSIDQHSVFLNSIRLKAQGLIKRYGRLHASCYADFLPKAACFYNSLQYLLENLELEWIDPIQGACDLSETNSMDIPEGSSELMQQYAESMPAVVQEWWQRLR